MNKIASARGFLIPRPLIRPGANKGKVKLANFTCPARCSLVFMAGNRTTGQVETGVFLCAPV
ncbi:hypothetical protein EGX65_24105 [Escherichia coli]|nr:hypothetical protein [Escherichia coli]EEW5973909.1 hypothetical protein [Escherichia coli]EEY3544012.1 hypothetical protein [Escherichia coli]EEY3549369.1 hypothetical protein [Escherichia coli]EEY3554536.1 hypothetical protein [Escherichia coli]